jgi:hypothetical protein
MQFNNQINYKRILSLLAFSIVTITIILYMALTEGKPEEYKFIGDWSCLTKDKKSTISLTITDSYFSVNNKKESSYFPKNSKKVENEYIFFNGKEKIARVKELGDDNIRFKSAKKDSIYYYCSRNQIKK